MPTPLLWAGLELFSPVRFLCPRRGQGCTSMECVSPTAHADITKPQL